MFLIAVLALLIGLQACSRGAVSEEHDAYTCPMHVTVVASEPGVCPVCGMDLVRKSRPGEAVVVTEDLAKLLKSPNETVVSGIRTVRGTYKSVSDRIPVKGLVTYDPKGIYTISSRVAGRIEKTSLKYEFQPVQKGQMIVEIYSPEILAAQREVLSLPDGDHLIESARHRLELLGFTKNQLDELIKSRNVSGTYTMYSPHAGYLVLNALSSSAGNYMRATTKVTMSNGKPKDMAAIEAGAPSNNSTLIREGTYVSPGQPLFTIVSDEDVRIELDLTPTHVTNIKKGDQMDIDFGHMQSKATVDFIQPFFSDGQNFVKLRVDTHNHEGLHIGHFVDAVINMSGSEALWVPRQAVVDLGEKQIVFVKSRGAFQARTVMVGPSASGEISVLKGLASSDEIASNAQYLIDSESFTKSSN